MIRSTILFALFALASLVFADVPGDLVTTLPGYPGKLPQRHYSGLIASDAAETVYLHYWFIEATTNPKTAPVVVWLNGGPGCSSLDGLLSELGPLHFSGEVQNGVPVLIDNPYAWTQVANVIFLESPAGVGFSYAKNGSIMANDEITSQNNYGFLKNWFAAFSEYANNPLYLTGESYAGIYVPTFAQRIWEGAQSGDNKFNFKGIAAGNGCWGNNVGTCGSLFGDAVDGLEYSVEFFHDHAMISEPHWQDVVANCPFPFTAPLSDKCQDAIGATGADGGDYNVYDIYDTCPDPIASSGSKSLRAPTSWSNMLRHSNVPRPSVRKIGTPDVCTGTEPVTWLNIPDVQKALHVDTVNASWAICNDDLNQGYDHSLADARPSYKTLVDNGYQVLIYSGDVDSCVPFVGTERWTSELGYKEVTPWAPWTINEQVMGYVTYYERNFTYLTVKGAGHMVPQYAPQAALAMITRFINGGQF